MHIDQGTSVNRNPRRAPPLEFKFCQAVQHFESAEIRLESAWWKSQEFPVIRLFFYRFEVSWMALALCSFLSGISNFSGVTSLLDISNGIGYLFKFSI